MKRTFIIIAAIVSCLFVGFLASRIQADSVATWYPSLEKSPLTPPDGVFGAVWTVLYICMGLSIGYIVSRRNPKEMIFIGLFTIQLFLNFMWSILFFYAKNPFLGLIDILFLDLVVLIYLITAYRWANRFSFAMFIPYFLWILFATYLNWYIVLHNGVANTLIID